jgi:hypothetical protein
MDGLLYLLNSLSSDSPLTPKPITKNEREGELASSAGEKSETISFRKDKPSFSFLLINTVKLLQHYPAGITKSILLTELETKW